MKLAEINNIKTDAELDAVAQKHSIENPGLYVVLESCFGVMVFGLKRLSVTTPQLSIRPHYWLNGNKRPFTEKQKQKVIDYYNNCSNDR